MNLYLTAIIIAFGFVTQGTFEMNSITKNNMTVKWQVRDQHLYIKALAPTKGWVAVGLNKTTGLTGTNLIMGCVRNDKLTIDDRFIIGPGNHQSIKSLGGHYSLRHIEGSEHTHTKISFELPLDSPDKFHQDLITGQPYYLLMAYSMEDGFDHHSIMRTGVKIIL